MVTLFNKTLFNRAGALPFVRKLDFFSNLLDEDGKLREQYNLDDTHLDPSYLQLLQDSIAKIQPFD